MRQRLEHAAHPNVQMRWDVSAESVQQELKRILASIFFLNSRRSSEFLEFIVETTLAGEGQRIKEYLIGVEVFGRPETYEPKDDPIVRIEAGRLRKKLADYYAGPGSGDSVIVELPKGGYVPIFQPGPVHIAERINDGGKTDPLLPPSLDHAEARRPWVIPAIAAILLVTISLAEEYYVRVRPQRPNTPTSIAVLPFSDLSEGQVREYISDGLTEELTTGLAELKGLRVVAARSAFQFRGKPEDVRKIGQALNAEILLEGSVRQSGGGLRIDAQLINAKNGYNLWSKAYDVQAADLLTPEQDIVRETAKALRIVAANSTQPFKSDTANPEAHDLYLRGRYLWSRRDLPDMQESVRLFERAIRDDPNYALAYGGLADAFTVMSVNQQMPPAEGVPRAKAALERALQLDPNLAEAHATLGLLKSQCEWDFRGGEAEFRRAIDLQPTYAEAHHWAGLNYMSMGQFQTAEAEFRQAQLLDPLSLMITEGLEENFFFSRRYDDAISTALHMAGPRHGIGDTSLAASYIFKGMYEEALEILKDFPDHDPTGSQLRAEALALSGHGAEALKILKQLESGQHNTASNQAYIPSEWLGEAYAVLGDKQKAFAWLEKAYQQREPGLGQIKIDPAFDSLRSDPRYLDLLKRMNLAD
jgi:TolB-like protein